jgi:hypothetical protein
MKITYEYLYKEYIIKRKSMTQIAKENNCAYSSINRYLKLYNIKSRTNGEIKIKDISGKKFGQLTAISLDKSKKNKKGWILPRWLCLCNCGNTYKVYYNHLRDGTTTRCLQCTHKSQENKEEFSNLFWRQIVKEAKKRNINISIKKTDAYNVLIKQNKKCILSNIPLYMSNSVRNHNKTTASLDRINSNKGYTIDNIQWVHKHINIMKHNYDLEYFLFLCLCINKDFCLPKFDINSYKLLPYYYNMIQRRAKTKKRQFNIKREECYRLLEEQNFKCKISQLPIFFTSSYKHQHGQKSTASLDRIDSCKGYTTDNIQWVHKHVNMMKNNYDLKYFTNICEQISHNIPKKEKNNIFNFQLNQKLFL